MTKRLYIGNLSFNTTEEEIKELFGQVGLVESVEFISDFETGRKKGFGFVEVAAADSGKMIAEFNGKQVGGRLLTVNEARPRTSFRRA